MDGIGITDTGSNTIQFDDERGRDRRGQGADRQLPGRVRPRERHADRGGHQERHEPVPRWRLRRHPQLRLELEHLGEQAERQSRSSPTSSRRQDWGYTLGGPIGKPGGNNKLFFFFAQEWRPRETSGSIARFRVPTPAERQGDFSQSRDNNGNIYSLIRDASTNLPCTTANTSGCFQDGGVLGRIPASRLNQLGLAVLNFYPLPTSTGQETNAFNAINIASTGQAAAAAGDLSSVDYQVSHDAAAVAGRWSRRTTRRWPTGPFTQGRFGIGNNGLFNGFNDMVDWVPLHDAVLDHGRTTRSTATTFLEASYGYFLNDIATTAITPGEQHQQHARAWRRFRCCSRTPVFLEPGFYAYKKLTEPWPGRGAVLPRRPSSRFRRRSRSATAAGTTRASRRAAAASRATSCTTSTSA